MTTSARALRLLLVLGTAVVLAGVGLLLGRTARGDDPRYELPEASAAQLAELADEVAAADAAAAPVEEPGAGATPIALPPVADVPRSVTVPAAGSVPDGGSLVADGVPLTPNPGGGPDLEPPDLDLATDTDTAADPAPASAGEADAAFADAPELAAAFTALDGAHRLGGSRPPVADVDVFVDPCTLGVTLVGCDGVAATVLAGTADGGRPLPSELRILTYETVFDSDPAAPACRAQTGGDRGRDLWIALRTNVPASGTGRLVFSDPDHAATRSSRHGVDVVLEPDSAQRTAWARSYDAGLTPEPFTLCARIPRDVLQSSLHHACPWSCNRVVSAFVDLTGLAGRTFANDEALCCIQVFDRSMAEADALAEPTRITPIGDRALRVEATIQAAAGDGEDRLREGRVLAATAIPSSVECRDHSPATNQPPASSRQVARTQYQLINQGQQARASIELVLPADSQPGTTYHLCVFWIGSANRSFEADDVRRIEQHLVVPPTFPRVTFSHGPAGDLGAGPFELDLGGALPRIADRCDEPRRAGEVICVASAYELGNFLVGDAEPGDEVLASVVAGSGGSVALPADGVFEPRRIPLDRRGCRGSRTFAVPVFPRSDETVPITVTCELENVSVGTIVQPGQPEPGVEYLDFSDHWVIDPPGTGDTIGVVEAGGDPAGEILTILDSPPLLDTANVVFSPVGGSVATATEYRLDLAADRPAHLVITLTPDGPAVPPCPPVRIEADTDDQGRFGVDGIHPCAGTRYGARVDLTATSDPAAGTSTFGPAPGLVFESPTTFGDGTVRRPGRYLGLSFSGPPASAPWSASWTLQPAAGLSEVRLEHIDLRIDGRAMPMGGASSASCRTLPEPLPGDGTGLQGPDAGIVGVHRFEVLLVVVPCDDAAGDRRQVVRLSGAAFVSNLAGGARVTVEGGGWQATLLLLDRPQ